MTLPKVRPQHFQTHDVVLPPLHTWNLLLVTFTTNKPQAWEPLHAFVQKCKMWRCIWDCTFQLLRILEQFGIEAVKEAIEVFTEMGSCKIVLLTLACKTLNVCQSLDPNSNWVTQDLCGEPYPHGSKWRKMDMLLGKMTAQTYFLPTFINVEILQKSAASS